MEHLQKQKTRPNQSNKKPRTWRGVLLALHQLDSGKHFIRLSMELFLVTVLVWI